MFCVLKAYNSSIIARLLAFLYFSERCHKSPSYIILYDYYERPGDLNAESVLKNKIYALVKQKENYI